jgi:hypothetical protein
MKIPEECGGMGSLLQYNAERPPGNAGLRRKIHQEKRTAYSQQLDSTRSLFSKAPSMAQRSIIRLHAA